MGKKRKKNSSDKQLAKIALITAALALANSIITLIIKLIEWLGKP